MCGNEWRSRLDVIDITRGGRLPSLHIQCGWRACQVLVRKGWPRYPIRGGRVKKESPETSILGRHFVTHTHHNDVGSQTRKL